VLAHAEQRLGKGAEITEILLMKSLTLVTS
jgi:hypothetical protein